MHELGEDHSVIDRSLTASSRAVPDSRLLWMVKLVGASPAYTVASNVSCVPFTPTIRGTGRLRLLDRAQPEQRDQRQRAYGNS